MSFAHQAHSSPLFKNLNVLELTDIVKNSNLLFTHNTINKNSPAVFYNYFLFDEASHPHQTVNSLTLTYAPVKLFSPHPPEQPRGQRKYVCDKEGRGTRKKGDYGDYIGQGK